MATFEELLLFIAARTKQLRKEHKMSQLDLAMKVGIDRNQISRIENAENNVSIKTLHKLVEQLDVEFSEFFNFKDIK
ncbi:MAG: helix-turn-helix transcriptional regulator [Bacilli bacterium]